MISVSNNKEEIFRKGLNDDVVKSFKNEVVYKINNNVLLYSTGNYIQYPVITL